jgi:hypothetical protein
MGLSDVGYGSVAASYDSDYEPEVFIKDWKFLVWQSV